MTHPTYGRRDDSHSGQAPDSASYPVAGNLGEGPEHTWPRSNWRSDDIPPGVTKHAKKSKELVILVVVSVVVAAVLAVAIWQSSTREAARKPAPVSVGEDNTEFHKLDFETSTLSQDGKKMVDELARPFEPIVVKFDASGASVDDTRTIKLPFNRGFSVEVQMTRRPDASRSAGKIVLVASPGSSTSGETSELHMDPSSTATATAYRAFGARSQDSLSTGRYRRSFSELDIRATSVSYTMTIRPLSSLPVMKKVSFGGAFCQSELLYEGPGKTVTVGWNGAQPQREDDVVLVDVVSLSDPTVHKVAEVRAGRVINSVLPRKAAPTR